MIDILKQSPGNNIMSKNMRFKVALVENACETSKTVTHLFPC